MKLLLVAIFGSIIIYLGALDWRRSIKALFAIVVLEGALRKWFLPQASDLFYFFKDFVLIGAYLRFFLFTSARQKVPIRNHFLLIPIFLVTVWALFQAFNPSLGSFVIGLFGLKAYVFYIPIMWMLPTLFSTEEDLYKFLRTHLLLIFITGLLGIAQFFSPPDSILNVYAPGQVVSVATFVDSGLPTVRVTGTFSYINSYTGYLIVSFGLLFPMLTIRQSSRWRWVTITELILVVVNSFMTGSRGLVFSEGIFLFSFLAIRALQPNHNLRLIRQLTLPLLMTGISVLVGFGAVLERFHQRVTGNQDLSGRVTNMFLEPIQFAQLKGLDGYGTGATHQGSEALRRVLQLPPGETIPVYYEPELGRIILELGPIGFTLWYGLRIALAFCLLTVFRTVQRPFLRQLALAACLIQIIQMISGFLVFHHTFAPYYWFLSGFIFLIPHLEQMEQIRQAQLVYYNGSPYFPGYHSPQS